tara:strand:- start:2209 stop:3534 length:1326 start_codon:yes stop_codon:yes gene_type:complete
MKKVQILDVYPNKNFRISKDQNGGYGTANDYGDNLILKILSLYIKKNIDYPPLFAVHAIAELRKKSFVVDYSRKLNTKEDYKLYIIPSSIVCYETEKETVKKLVSLNKKVFVIGPFASSKPELYYKYGAKVISGEAEFYLKDFDQKKLDNFESLPNIIYHNHNYDLNDLEFPAWDIVIKKIKPVMKLLGSGTTIPINASRGCPYSCYYYCTYPKQQGRKLRLRKVENIINEMEYWNNTLGTTNYIFRDPVFSINKTHSLELLKRISESKIKYKICIETHLKNIDDELVKLFKSAGIKLVYVGIESGDSQVLIDSKRTTIDFDEQIEKVKLLEQNNIKVKSMYIIGQPTDNEITCLKTINYSKKILSTYAQFSVFTPYPGTPVYSEYKDRIIAKKYEDYNQWQLIFKHDNLSSNKIRKLLNKAYISYYFNPYWILKFLKKGI